MKKYFNKEFVMTKEDDEEFENCWIYVEGDVKVTDHFHITGRDSADRDYHIKVKLNHKSPTVFHNIINYN